MVDLVKIDDETITSDELVLNLKFNNELDHLLDQMIRDRLLAIGARKAGIEATAEEVQERADQIRRILGLHRSADMHAYLDRLQASVEDFERFVTLLVIKSKMTEQITADDKLEAHFRLHSPKFDTVTLGHIAVLEEGAANEIVALLEDEPKLFSDLAREHSISDTAEDGGLLGRVRRGQVDPRVESRLFNAELREPVGPIGEENGPFDVFMVLEKNDATLDEYTRGEVRRALLDEWITEAVKEVSIA